MAAGVGIAHEIVVGVGVAVLRDGRFHIAQVGVAGGEGAELGVVVPCAQVLQAGLRGVLLTVVGEDPALPRFTLQQATVGVVAQGGGHLARSCTPPAARRFPVVVVRSFIEILKCFPLQLNVYLHSAEKISSILQTLKCSQNILKLSDWKILVEDHCFLI